MKLSFNLKIMVAKPILMRFIFEHFGFFCRQMDFESNDWPKGLPRVYYVLREVAMLSKRCMEFCNFKIHPRGKSLVKIVHGF